MTSAFDEAIPAPKPLAMRWANRLRASRIVLGRFAPSTLHDALRWWLILFSLASMKRGAKTKEQGEAVDQIVHS